MYKLIVGLTTMFVMASAPAAVSAPTQNSKTAATAAPSTATPAAPNSTGGSESGFKTEAAAKAHCPGDTVMWGNPSGKVLHYQGTPDFGKTKRGSYMCEKDATKIGYHVAKNEKHS
ncbi:MAG TPA: hypothetical protein VLI93_10520 [Acetobacteraceae bacterium]|nr:hypothetical protein [Acetobacteraceae bacterium]